MTSQETTLCSTRYPIMLVHGVGARDSLEQCYWRRIPDYLRQRGAVVEFGFQDSWATVEQNAAMLATRIAWVCREYGCEKVNLIAHSKGGLDARYAISALGMEGQVASLTTLSTPHHGSRTVDFFFRFRGNLSTVTTGILSCSMNIISVRGARTQKNCLTTQTKKQKATSIWKNISVTRQITPITKPFFR